MATNPRNFTVLAVTGYRSLSQRLGRNGGILRRRVLKRTGDISEWSNQSRKSRQSTPNFSWGCLRKFSQPVSLPNAPRTQVWCLANLPVFWMKEVTPSISDLSSTVNIRPIMQSERTRCCRPPPNRRRAGHLACRLRGAASAPRFWTTWCARWRRLSAWGSVSETRLGGQYIGEAKW